MDEEHQKRFEEMKQLFTEQISNTISDLDQLFYAICDASIIGFGAPLLKLHKGTNKMSFISANSRILTQAKLRFSTLMRECTAVTNSHRI